MGLLDRFRKKEKQQEQAQPELHTIDHTELDDWIGSQLGAETGSAEKRAMELRSAAVESVSSARNSISSLEKASFGGSDKTFAAANMAKDSFAKKALSTTDAIRVHDAGRGSFSMLDEYSSKIADAMKVINAISPKQIFLLSKYFSQDTKKVMEALKSMENRGKEISGFLGNDGRVLLLKNRLEEKSSMLSEAISKEEMLRKEEKDVKAEIQAIESRISSAKKETERLYKSPQWKEFMRIESALRKSRSKMDEIERSANEMLNLAKRPLKKLKHLKDAGTGFPDNPFRDMALDSRLDHLKDMLRQAAEKSESGEIKLKPKENERIADIIMYVEGKLPGQVKDYIELGDRARQLEDQARNFKSKRDEQALLARVDELDRERKKKWGELDQKMRELKSAESETGEIKASIEKVAAEAGKRLELRINRKRDE